MFEKINELLLEYKKTKSEDIKSELISYLIKYQTEIFNKKMSDRNFRPNNEDEFHEKRKIMEVIREEINILIKGNDQYPPDNIPEIRDIIKKTCEEQNIQNK